MRKFFAAALMLILSASLLLVGGTFAVEYYVKNGTTTQVNYHDTDATDVATATNGNQVASVPPKTDPGYTVWIVFPDDTGSVQSEPVYTNISVVPNNVVVSVNQTFSVELWINNVTDMAGWEINLLWNRSVLKCVQAQVNTPLEWGGVAFDWFGITESDVNEIDSNSVNTAWLLGSGIDNSFSATYGQYFRAECFGPYGSGHNNTFTGSIAIVTLTFQALQAGSTSLALLECGKYRADEDISHAYEKLIANEHAELIAHIDYSGFVEVQD